MRKLLHQFAQWRAEIGRQLNENEVWREVVKISTIICAPVVGVSRTTLRIFPSLRKLEWLLEIDSLSKRHPVMLSLSLAFVFWRGLMTTPLGHIGTDKLIYPMLGAISGYNPFLGMLCGVGYGAGDLIQKFILPDMYGADGWLDLNYWGGMIGYVVAYSSIMMMGLFPGMASRAARAAVVAVVKNMFARRATRMADGGVPLGTAVSPVAEMVAAATAGLAAGWTVMYQVAPVTEMPAFLWRPNPDVSCHNLEVDTHLKGYAVVGGSGAALGGLANVVLPPPEPAPPDLPDEFEWTAPNGVTHLVRKNAEGEYINILTGGLVDVTNLEKWKGSWVSINKEQRDWGDEQMEKLVNRDTDFDREMDRRVAEEKERQKAWENLSQMHKNIFFGTGPESKLYKAPGEAGNILDHIEKLKNQIAAGRPLDKEKYAQIYKVYKAQKQGNIIQSSQMPSDSQITRDTFNNTLENTASEFLTGKKEDGSTSWLGIGGRALTAIVTGGGSEFVLVPANAVKTMKDYVDKGGDSTFEGFKQAVATVLVDELTGRAAGGVLKTAGKAGKAIANVAGEAIEQSARNGSSTAKALVNAAQGAGKAAKSVANAATRPVSFKPSSTSTAAKAGKVATPSSASIARDAGRAGSTNVRTVKAGIPASDVKTGFTPNQVKHVKVVADKYGVLVDARPTNPHSEAWIKSGKAVPKPEFIKTKTLTPLDEFLGAKGPPGQVGYYKPKMPPKGTMSDKTYKDLKKLYDSRLKEFADESKAIEKLCKKGDAYVKDGVVYSGKPPAGKPFAGDVDVFDIRDPVTGKPLPRYQVDHKGNIRYDANGKPKMNPVREAVMNDLKNGPCQAQHGSHMDWKYDQNRPAPGSPVDPQAAEKFAHDQKIDSGVIDKHKAGGEPLVSYGPNGSTEAVYIEGGR